MHNDTVGSPHRVADPPAGDAVPNDTPTVVRMVILAAAAAVVLVMSITFASGHGFLPAQVVTGADDTLQAPRTADPATTAPGSQPVYQSSCEFMPTPPGAQCAFALGDDRGHLVEQGLAVEVPKAWLARFNGPTTVNDMEVIAALTRSPYAPLDGPGLESMSISVTPSYASQLATVGVTPQQFLQWLYQNVPAAHRPPWVEAG